MNRRMWLNNTPRPSEDIAITSKIIKDLEEAKGRAVTQAQRDFRQGQIDYQHESLLAMALQAERGRRRI